MSEFWRDYTAKWAGYVSAGPVDWRSPHHGRPDPEFASLCADAERRDLTVELGVTPGKTPLDPKGYPHRKFTRLAVRKVGVATPLVTETFRADESIRSIAARVRRGLERA